MKLPKEFSGPWRSEDVPSPEEQIRKQMIEAGINPPDVIHIDSAFHRFSTNGKSGDTAGWYIFNYDAIVNGAFGDWRAGGSGYNQSFKFTCDIGRKMTMFEKRDVDKQIEEAHAKRDAAMKQKHEEAAHDAVEKWKKATPATESNPYLKRKKIHPHGARVTEDNTLIIPIYNPSGEMTSLQYIDKDGKKLFLKGGVTKGCFHTIGDLYDDNNKIVYMAEGFATGATIYEETKIPVVISFSAHNLVPVTQAIREKHKDKHIIIIADSDKSGVGENYANQAAAKFGATVKVTPMEEGDINDFRAAGGDVKKFLQETTDIPYYYSASEIGDDYIPPDEIVEDFFTSDSLSILYGATNSGKTFFAVHLAAAVSTGGEFFGKCIDPGPVLYLATEAPGSIKIRVQAIKKERGGSYEDLFILPHPINLYSSATDDMVIINIVKDIEAKTGKKVKMIIADTLARIASGADENSSQMGPVMDRFSRIKDITGAAIVIIHHSGKDATRGSRGWSGVTAAIDTEIELNQVEKIHTAKITKQRELGSKEQEHNFRLRVVKMGLSKFKKDATTCIVEPTDDKPEEIRSEKKEDKKIEKMKKSIMSAWKMSGCEYIDENPYITKAALKKYLMEMEGKSDGSARLEVAPGSGRLMSKLIENRKVVEKNSGFIVIDDDMITIMALRNVKK